MNERIEKLLKEAYSEFGHGKYRTQELVAEKFALLIARECANICDDLSFSPEGPSNEARYQRGLCAGEIRKQFGVPVEFRKGA